MNALTLLIIALCVFVLAYRYYSAFLSAKVLTLDPSRKTPAHSLNDHHDYHPTNKWVLFGHHFAAIAGAGPLIGPVLAAQFGFLPGAIWIIIGAVLAGAVHDYVILFASVRHNGLSLHKIARDYIGRTTGIATAIAVLFIIVTALAGLSIVVVNALAESPWGTFAIAASIPAAMIVGFYMNVFRKNAIHRSIHHRDNSSASSRSIRVQCPALSFCVPIHIYKAAACHPSCDIRVLRFGTSGLASSRAARLHQFLSEDRRDRASGASEYFLSIRRSRCRH